ncbi:MAG: DivIVA domain-containing protein [Clostridia bacterium]|nr:DivIVA domain-containing protein [Clostridia bacterium]
MYKFDITKKGYNTIQVDNYINKELDSYKQIIAEKNMRISELLHMNNNLNKQIEEFKMREDNVNKALITAVEKSQEMELLIKKSFNIELERLRIWRDKWVAYAEKCKGIVGFTNTKGEVIGIISALENELIEKINSGISLNTEDNISVAEEQYSKELARQDKNKSHMEEYVDADEEIERILSNPEFNKLIKSLGIA